MNIFKEKFAISQVEDISKRLRRCLVVSQLTPRRVFSSPPSHEIHKLLSHDNGRKEENPSKNLFYRFFFPFPPLSFETEQKELAIRLYKEGILELERGINIDVWQGHGEKYQKAQRLHDKMQTNLAMAKDRLHFLGEFLRGFMRDLNFEVDFGGFGGGGLKV
jgi:hypothetical protein